MKQTIEREMNGSIQRMLLERYLNTIITQIKSLIFSFELLGEVYEINPSSELIRKWHLDLLQDKTSRSSI